MLSTQLSRQTRTKLPTTTCIGLAFPILWRDLHQVQYKSHEHPIFHYIMPRRSLVHSSQFVQVFGFELMHSGMSCSICKSMNLVDSAVRSNLRISYIDRVSYAESLSLCIYGYASRLPFSQILHPMFGDHVLFPYSI